MSWYKVTFKEKEFKDNLAIIQHPFHILFERSGFDAKVIGNVGVFKFIDPETRDHTLYFTPDAVRHVPRLVSTFDMQSCEVPSAKGLELVLGVNESKSLIPDWDFS